MISVLCEMDGYQHQLDEGFKQKVVDDTLHHKRKGQMSFGHAFKGAVGGMIAKSIGAGKDLDEAIMKDRQLKAQLVKKLRRQRSQETTSDKARRKKGKVVHNRRSSAYA